MRKIKLQMQVTIDGFVAGPNGELDWMVWEWDDGLKAYVNDLTVPVDTILMGRKMTDGFISHWTSVAANPDDPSYAFGKKMMDTPKIVFSKTLEKSKWANTELAKGDLTQEIVEIKNQSGKDIVAYGGAGFASSLIRENLIDEYYLFVNPVALSKGMTIFAGLEDKMRLKLVKSQAFACGIVLLCYEPKR